MPLHFSRGRPGDSCDVCERDDLPNVHVYTAGTDEPEVVCIDCLAGAIELVCKWRVRATISRWLATSDAADVFRSLDNTRRPARRNTIRSRDDR